MEVKIIWHMNYRTVSVIHLMESGWTMEKPSRETGLRINLGHLRQASFNCLEGRVNTIFFRHMQTLLAVEADEGLSHSFPQTNQKPSG